MVVVIVVGSGYVCKSMLCGGVGVEDQVQLPPDLKGDYASTGRNADLKVCSTAL